MFFLPCRKRGIPRRFICEYDHASIGKILPTDDLQDVGLNPTTGCSHKCRYCHYSHHFRVTRLVDRASFLELVESFARHKTRIFFSDRSDPYQNDSRVIDLVSEAIEIVRHYKSPVDIYTKGGRRVLQHLNLIKSARARLVMTLSMVDPADAAHWELGADTPAGRMEAIRAAFEAGIHTCLAVGPVIFHRQALEVIEQLRDHINALIFCGAVRSPVPFPAPEMSPNEFRYHLDRLLDGYRGRVRVGEFVAAVAPEVQRCDATRGDEPASGVGEVLPAVW